MRGLLFLGHLLLRRITRRTQLGVGERRERISAGICCRRDERDVRRLVDVIPFHCSCRPCGQNKKAAAAVYNSSIVVTIPNQYLALRPRLRLTSLVVVAACYCCLRQLSAGSDPITMPISHGPLWRPLGGPLVQPGTARQGSFS